MSHGDRIGRLPEVSDCLHGEHREAAAEDANRRLTASSSIRRSSIRRKERCWRISCSASAAVKKLDHEILRPGGDRGNPPRSTTNGWSSARGRFLRRAVLIHRARLVNSPASSWTVSSGSTRATRCAPREADKFPPPGHGRRFWSASRVTTERKRRSLGESSSRSSTGRPEDQGVDFLAQGRSTISSNPGRPRGPSAVIKSHHNVGGLPKKMRPGPDRAAQTPLQTRSASWARSSSFRRPTLAAALPGRDLRCGSSGGDRKRLAILRMAERSQEEIRAGNYYRKLWQSFAVLLPLRASGSWGIILRAHHRHPRSDERGRTTFFFFMGPGARLPTMLGRFQPDHQRGPG